MECIILNDGSMDGTEEICREFSERDSRFRLINKENTGVSDTRNMGIGETVGDYVFFLDADDYIIADCWHEILARAVEGKYDMVAFGYYNLFENGRTSIERFPKGCDLKKALLGTTLLNTCFGSLLRRELIIKNKTVFKKGLKTCEDAIFIIDFAENVDTYLLCDTSVLYYRIHSASVMRNTGIESKLVDFAFLFERRKAYLATHYDEETDKAMYRQFFSGITDLFRSGAKDRKISEIRRLYKESVKNPTAMVILNETKREYLSPFYKKLEYDLICGGHYAFLAVYFKIKGYFS